MTDVLIVAAARTPIGSFQGSLSGISAHQLGAKVIHAVIERSHLKPEQIDEVIMGQVLRAGTGQNPARQAALAAGLPDSIPAMTIDKVCGSSLKAMHLASQAIRCGDAHIIIAGGQENMSQAPHILPNSRNGIKLGDWKMIDSLVNDGLTCAMNNYHMGVTAENIADKYAISRKQQDEFAARSQQKAEAALADHAFADEIVPVEIPQKNGDPVIFDRDEFPKPGTTKEILSTLRPSFKPEGSVTAGNASGINDGAAAVLITSAVKAAELKLKPLARIAGFSSAGVDPKIMGTGPIPATRQCLENAGWSIDDLELIESNEAFAAQAISVDEDLGWDRDKVNISGGAIALGHPLGATGARILVTLLYGLQRKNKHKGLATLCIGGGMGVALAVERI